jgi:integrase
MMNFPESLNPHARRVAARLISIQPQFETTLKPLEGGHFEASILTMEQVKRCFEVLDLRERVIVKLAVLTGMRPGEILALRRGRVNDRYVDIRERIYKGQIDSPKTSKSVRKAALAAGVWEDVSTWLALSPDTGPDGWLFPSDTLKTPVSKDNVWRREIQPKLQKVNLGWANFQVFRRTHSTLMRQLNVDPKLVADQQGHTLDVNLNVYTQTPVDRLKEAVDGLESAILVH